MVHEARFARHGALRALSYAVNNSASNAAALVDAGGLKAIFPAFMGKSELRVLREAKHERDSTQLMH